MEAHGAEVRPEHRLVTAWRARVVPRCVLGASVAPDVVRRGLRSRETSLGPGLCVVGLVECLSVREQLGQQRGPQIGPAVGGTRLVLVLW